MPIIDRNSAKAKICPLNLHLLFCDFPCWYVTWAQIVKLQNGISSRRQKVPGPKDEIISGFAIPLFAPIAKQIKFISYNKPIFDTTYVVQWYKT